MLQDTGFYAEKAFAAVEPAAPVVAENVIHLNFAERSELGDPLTRAERVQVRRMLAWFEAVTNTASGCPVAVRATEA
jgi:hypothetical protein